MSSDPSRPFIALAADIGGTHTRVQLLEGKNGQLRPHAVIPEIQRKQLSSTSKLLSFLGQILDTAGVRHLTCCRIAAAGPVLDGHSVSMTNWLGVPDLDRHTFKAAGIDAEMVFLNDMTAAAIALANEIGRSKLDQKALEVLGGSSEAVHSGDFVLVSPGTGLGSAIGVWSEAAGIHVCRALEIQHSAIPCFDSHWASLWQALSVDLGRPPSWEQVVSGAGLRRVYRALGGNPAFEAAMIAERAANAGDPLAVDALTVFYRSLARFCQMLALALMPRCGVLIAGASTEKNASFLQSIDFMKDFLSNPIRRAVLEKISVQLYCKDLVLDGAIAALERTYSMRHK
jgi:glucokinase